MDLAAPIFPREDASQRLLHVGEGGRWYRVDGRFVDLSRRPTLARILWALAIAPTPVMSAELIVIGWPGEKIIARAAQIRIRVAIATLRSMGLARYIDSRRPGYALTCSVVLHRAAEAAA